MPLAQVPHAKAPPPLPPSSPAPQAPALQLLRAVGISCPNGAASLAHHPTSGVIALIAGCTVVLYDARSKMLGQPLSGEASKPFACVAISRCGRILAAGQRGASPATLVFELPGGRCVATLAKGHKHGVASVAFSPDGRLLASTGCSYDGQLCVWEVRSGSLLVKQHTCAGGTSACFSEDGGCVVTVGKEHFKAWSITQPAARHGARLTAPLAGAGAAGLLLAPKPASLKEFKSCTFVGVQAAVPIAPGTGPISAAASGGNGGVYALTSSGVLLLMRATGRTIDKSVNVQVHRAFALSVSASLVACACSSGLVRLFAARTLAFKINLPRPAASAGRELGGLEAEGLMARSSGVELYPDAVACSFEPSGAQLAVIYSDRSLLLWDVRDTTKVSRLRSLQSHSAGIWDAAMLILPSLAPSSSSPDRPSSSLAATSGPQPQQQPQSQPCCLVTCSADGSVRFWSLPQQRPGLSPAAAPGAAPPLEAARSLCCIQLDPPAAPAVPLLKGSVKPQPLGSGALAAAPLAAAAAVRCLALSPDGAHLAVGDGDGNLRVFDLRSNGQTPQLSALREAHDAELLTLAYSTFGGGRFLATGGRDGVVHVFDRSDDYTLVNTLDEHGGAAVTAVRFARCPGRGDVLLSCGADRAVVFRTVTDAQDCTVATYSREQVPAAHRTAPSPMAAAAVAAAVSPLPSGTGGGGGVLYDLALDASGLLAVTVGQDAALRIWDVAAGRQLGIIRQAGAESMAIRVALDPSGGLAACACADGSVALFDLVHAKGLVARSHGGGHGDVATSVLFAPDYQSVVSVGGDGCILQWGLPVELADRMQAANRAAAEVAAVVAARPATAVDAGRRQQEQRQEQGSGAAARAGPPRQAWGAVPAPPAAAMVPATPPPHADAEKAPSGALAPAPAAAAAAAATPSLPGGVNPELSATLRRLQQGRPLLSADKLPRWATRAPLPSFELPPDEEGVPSPSPCAGSGGSGGAAAKERRSGGGAKGGGDGVAWVSRGQDPRREKRPGGEEGQREGGGPGAMPRQAWGAEEEVKGRGAEEVKNVAQEEEEEEEQVVCKPVGLDPGTRFEVQAAPEPEGEEQEAGEDQEAVAEAAGAAAAAAALLASGGASNRMGGGHVGEEGQAAEAEEREGEASGAAPQPRDLFREHFDTLDQVSVTQGAAAGEGDPLQQGDGDGGEGQSQSRRLSLTATYRKLALSVLRAEGVVRGTGTGGAAGTAARPTERPPLPSAAAWQAAAAAVGSATPSAAPAASASLASGQHPHVTTTRGSLSLAELGAAVITSDAEGGGGGAGTPGWGAAVAAPAPAAAANGGVAAAEAVGGTFPLQQQGRQLDGAAAGQNGGGALVRPPSPLPPGGARAGGRLGGELAKMRERLEALQQQFEQQQQQGGGGGGGVGAGAVGWRSPRRPQQQYQQQEAASGEDADGPAFGAAASLRLPLPPVGSAGGLSPLSLASGGVFQPHPGCSGPTATLAPAAAAGPQSSSCALRPGLQDNPMFNASPASQQTSGASPAAFAFASTGADGGPAALVAFRNAAFSSSATEMESSPMPMPARPMLPLAALQQQHPQQGAVAAAAAHGLGTQRPGGGTGGGSGGTGSEITLAGGAAAVGGVEAEEGGGGAAAFLSTHGGALGSPSNCTIRKKMKVTAPGFKSVLSPSNPSKFSTIGELAAAMAAESAGARAVPSSVAAEPFGHPSAAAAAAAAADPMQQQQGCSDHDASGAAAAAAGSGSVPTAFTPVRKLPASGQQQQQQQQQPQGRAPDQYFAALQRLNAAAAEVAQMWGELQQDGADVGAGSDTAAAAPPNSGLPLTAMQQQQQQQQQQLQPASSEGASFASAVSGHASLASSASAAGAGHSSQLQARFQREVGGSLQALAAVVLAPATGGAASATPPNMGLGQQQQQR